MKIIDADGHILDKEKDIQPTCPRATGVGAVPSCLPSE